MLLNFVTQDLKYTIGIRRTAQIHLYVNLTSLALKISNYSVDSAVNTVTTLADVEG